MHDEVHRPGRRLPAGVLEALDADLHLVEPGLELLAAARAMGGEAAHDAFAAAGERQRGIGDQEHRCGDHGDRHAIDQLLDFGACHGQTSPTLGTVDVTPVSASLRKASLS